MYCDLFVDGLQPIQVLQAEEVRQAREAQEAADAKEAAKCQGLGDVGGILRDGIG